MVMRGAQRVFRVLPLAGPADNASDLVWQPILDGIGAHSD